MNRIFKIVSLISLISLIVSSCAVKNGFKSLDVYDYFDAKQKFEKAEKRKLVPSCYGLSIIYQRNDNPFHNIDSALIKIVNAFNNYPLIKESQKEKYLTFGVDSSSIVRQRDLISTLFFERALETNSIYGFQDFINKNKWSKNVVLATNLRDSLFFIDVDEKGKSKDYELFLNTYPNSVYKSKATELYQKSFYLENTKTNNINDYIKYLKEKPNGLYVDNAEDKIFELSTPHKTIEEYYNFLKTYGSNKNVNSAWLKLYDTYLQKEYSKQSIEKFLVDYPDYPFKYKVKNELLVIDVPFNKYKYENKWGFTSLDGTFNIDTKYEFVESFTEGLAVFIEDEKYGFITKTEDVKIKAQFDDAIPFQNGFAVVEVKDYFGLINRSGEFIVEPIFDDLGNVNNGLFYYEKDGRYGYFNIKGETVIYPQYDDALDFENNLAIVQKGDFYGLIDKNGSTKIAYQYQLINRIDDVCYIVKKNNSWGIINKTNTVLLDIDYDFIGNVKENVLIIENKNDQFNYWNKTTKSFVSTVWFDVYSEYKELAKFNNGYAKVETEAGFNFINLKGEFVLTNFYSDLGNYANNIAFKKEDGWGYVNLNNVVTILPNYSKTESFNVGGGVVQINGGVGLIDESGEILLPLFFDEIKVINDSVVIVMKDNHYGILSTNNDTILNIKYKLIEPFSNSVVKISGEGFLNYYNLVTKQWFIKRD